MVNVGLLCVAVYPLFVCIRLYKVIFANIVGIIFIGAWLTLRILDTYYCALGLTGPFVGIFIKKKYFFKIKENFLTLLFLHFFF